jgi:hypothetical protein
MCDMMKYSFAGEACIPPRPTRDILASLMAPDHAICYIMKNGKQTLHIAAWPSWLNKGYKRHVDIFLKVFYTGEEAPQ